MAGYAQSLFHPVQLLAMFVCISRDTNNAMYGVNVQAVVDHLYYFIYIAVAAPGSQPYINVINRTNLPDVLAALLLSFFHYWRQRLPCIPTSGL
jgi:hypothetical protein